MFKQLSTTLSIILIGNMICTGCVNPKIWATEKGQSGEPSAIPIIEITPTPPSYEPISIQQQNGQITKTFVVAQGTDLYALTEASFTEGDYLYSTSQIQTQAIPGDIETKMVTQTVPVDVPNNNSAEALAWYSPELDYSDEEGFSGRVSLQPETLTVTAKGTQTYSYQITDSRQYFNLPRNDPSAIARTTTKGGRVLELTHIDWQVSDQTMAGDSLIATKYNATAHYAANAQGKRVTGYIANAIYAGEVSKQGENQISCAVIYTGQLTPKGIAKRAIVPALTLALLLSLLLPPLWRRHQIHTLINQQEHPAGYLAEGVPSNAMVPPTSSAAAHKPFRLKSWWKKPLRQPIFVEMAEDEEAGKPAKAQKIYLPKNPTEKGDKNAQDD